VVASQGVVRPLILGNTLPRLNNGERITAATLYDERTSDNQPVVFKYFNPLICCSIKESKKKYKLSEF
jgi:hypothetical protein